MTTDSAQSVPRRCPTAIRFLFLGDNSPIGASPVGRSARQATPWSTCRGICSVPDSGHLRRSACRHTTEHSLLAACAHWRRNSLVNNSQENTTQKQI